MEPESSLPYSQAPATCPYPEHLADLLIYTLQYDARCIQRQIGIYRIYHN